MQYNIVNGDLPHEIGTAKGVLASIIENPSLLDHFFPGWVLAIVAVKGSNTPQFITQNAVDFWGMPKEELMRKSCHDMHAMIHPDDVEGFDRCKLKMLELQKTLRPNETLQYRFALQYRLIPQHQHGFRYVYEEHLTYLDQNNQPTQALLYRDATADRVTERLHLTWFRIHGMAYQKVGTYIPATADQKLTLREEEIMHLIKEGLNSKEIADRLCISLNTVKNHRKNLLRKTQSRNMVDLVR
ncbi:response regulator transcription factor [Dyadobacter fermentans]|uniref:response regulator transcription factor n=1 Tax=Dyadobacter fermentans TaxID=94254 RepID=UPI001CBD4E2E|nr:helix-turn-helix transcriptional regulator [Dyadobacter fermentans]MBZ1362890.1 helix-turn-helix transcriptional regulator [Dyadobacter fermentans]